MTLFRPAWRVRDPSGREWEIYLYRLELPAWRPAGGAGVGEGTRLELLLLPVNLLVYFLWDVLVPLARALVRLPVAVVRSRSSDVWTVQAVTWLPQRETYTWKTTAEYRGQVATQVAAGLQAGEIPRPRHADFLGAGR